MYYQDNGQISYKPPKPNMQIEPFCLAVHKNKTTRKLKCTLEYAGVNKQIAEKFSLISIFLLLLSHT